MDKRKFIKYIESFGFRYKRTNGSHRIYVNSKNQIFPVPLSHDKVKKGIVWSFKRNFVKGVK